MQGRGKGGMKSFIAAPDEKPKVTLPLLNRVLKYSLPYRFLIIQTLVLILAHTALTVLNPLIMRDLIDRTIPQKDVPRLILLAVALLLIPAINGGINVLQRRLTSRIGEGVIYDLRIALYAALQRMSLRFFTNTKVGELMSRLNNDVVGAQNAISNTIVGIITRSHPGSRCVGGHAQPGMAPHPDQRCHPPVIHFRDPPHGFPPAGYCPETDGSQCPNQCPDG